MRGWIGDNVMFGWNLWWVSTSIWERGSLFGAYCPLVFAPEGMHFLFSTHTWLYGFIYALVQAPWRLTGSGNFPGITLMYNLLLVWSSFACAAAVGLLCLAHGIRSYLAIAMATVIVTFQGYRLFALYGHVNYLAMEFVLFSIACACVALWRADTPRRQFLWWSLAGFGAGLAWLNDSTFGMFSLFFWAIAAIANTLVNRREPVSLAAPLCFWIPLSGMSGYNWFQLSKVFSSPAYVVMSLNVPRISDAINTMLPADLHAIWGIGFGQLRKRLGIEGEEGAAFLGWSAIVILPAFLAARRNIIRKSVAANRQIWFWAIVGVTFFIISRGDKLLVAGRELLPLPGVVLRWIPVVNNLRAPARFTLFVNLSIALAAAAVMQHLAFHGTRRTSWIFFTAVAALFAAGLPMRWHHVRTDSQPLKLPAAVIHALSDGNTTGTLLVLPTSYSEQRPLWWQTQHGRAVNFGAAARISPALMRSRTERFPALPHLASGHNPSISGAVNAAGGTAPLRTQMAEMCRRFQVGYIITFRPKWKDADEFVTSCVPGAVPLYGDSYLTLFRLTPQPL